MTLRFGVVGCGDVCEVKSGPALQKARGSALRIVMRRNAALAEDFARRHGVGSFTTDAQAVIEHPEVDIVYVATPPGSHCEYALRAAAAGKACYVEKPMARSAVECRRMVEAFAARGLPLFVAYYRRALPRFERLRELIESELGTVHAVSHVYQGVESAASGWREEVEHSGGGLFLDLGSHVLDLMDHLFGPLEGVMGHAARRCRRPLPVEDTVVASFRLGCGALGTIRHQYHTSASRDCLEVVGRRATLRAAVFSTEPIELWRAGSVTHVDTEQPDHVHQPLVQTIADELAGVGRCPSTGASALRTSLVIDRILESYYGGREDAFWERPERYSDSAWSRG